MSSRLAAWRKGVATRLPLPSLQRWAFSCSKAAVHILGVGDHCELGDMYLRLVAGGDEVRVYIRETESHGILSGMIRRVEDWRAELDWVRDGLIVFETAHDGAIQDKLRAQGYRVIGGSAFGDRLEGDRAFGQRILQELGFTTARIHHFTDFPTAAAFVREQRARFVVKMNGSGFASWRNYVGRAADGRDVAAFLDAQARRWAFTERPDFILMDFVDGVEMGVGAYFNGESFLSPACLDWEHKRFFPGNLGELTGEMGTLVTYQNTAAFFERTLAKMQPLLRQHGYVGYININTIVTERGIWPLEFTCRFGYPGFAILDPLQRDGWGPLLKQMAYGKGGNAFATNGGFALGVVLTVPPFPYRFGYEQLSKGAPIFFDLADTDSLHPGEVALDVHGDWVAAGCIGYLVVATGRGSSASEARTNAYAVASRVVCPNLRYRNDIGENFAEDARRLASWNYFNAAG